MRFPIPVSVWTLMLAPCWLVAQDEAPAPSVSIADQAGVVQGPPISLFDGQSLSGWMRRDGTPSKNWTVNEGALYRASGGGDLYHQHWYRDFDLRFEWKIADKGNSGLKYRVQPYGNQMLGCEYQVQDDQGQLWNKQATGGLYAIAEPGRAKRQHPNGEWNESRIVVCGSRIEHWLNGALIVRADVASADWRQRVQASKFRSHAAFGENREGRLFLQDHGNPVWFRNLVVVPLDADGSALAR